MAIPKASPTRLYAILARNGTSGVIFRRGPTKQVQLIKWNLKDDSLERGQWFKGRIYERRCDLSPSGNLLIYFAATYKGDLKSWTAISKPPYFTALALWPKGDGWNGGGWFDSEWGIYLNHPFEAVPHPDFEAGCRKFKIESLALGMGEDRTVSYYTEDRDGWEIIQDPAWEAYSNEGPFFRKAKVPEITEKKNPKNGTLLRRSLLGISKRQGPWYFMNYEVRSKDHAILDLGICDWADWDQNGDLLFCREGGLFRQKITRSKPGLLKKIADFTDDRFSAVEAPEWAKQF